MGTRTNLCAWVQDHTALFDHVLKAEAQARYSASVGPGWNKLTADLFSALAEIQKIAPGSVKIVQIKQKFGLLRIYLAAGNPEAYELIDAASLASGRICEICGEPSTVRNRGGWLTTACDGWYRP